MNLSIGVSEKAGGFMDLMFVIGIVVFALLFLCGIPIWMALVVGAAVMGVFSAGMSPTTVPLTLFTGLDSFLLLALPFFIFGGNIMAKTGPGEYFFKTFDAWLGHLPAGLPIATIGSCMAFGAVTGSALADLVAVGNMAVPSLIERGYPKKFTLALLCCSGTLGLIIPPSGYMIIYAAFTGTNLATLFAAGLIPGIIVGLFLMGMAFIECKRGGLGTLSSAYSWRERWIATLQGAPALGMPIIILGGIYSGFFTPTEAAAVAAIYGLFVARVVYRRITWGIFKDVVLESARTVSFIGFIMAAAVLFSIPLAYKEIPQDVTRWLIQMQVGRTELIFMIILLWLVMGCFLDPSAIIVLTLPVVYPSLVAYKINLAHFCVICVVCMQIGLITPPFGLSLYATSSIWKEPIPGIVRSCVPFLVAMLATLPVLVFLPELSLWFPNLLGLR
jgi:C4-dicarboxylate transporter, DctM subunit